MNISVDKETKICGFGPTPEEALQAMHFKLERRGRLTPEREERRKELHAWLPRKNMLHIQGVGAVIYEDGWLYNLRTDKRKRMRNTPLSQYRYLYNILDGEISYEDFTLTIGPEVNQFVKNISETFLTLNDFPYIQPAERIQISAYHTTVIPELIVMETVAREIVVSYQDKAIAVTKTPGVENTSLLSYMLASIGFLYDGETIRRIHED